METAQKRSNIAELDGACKKPPLYNVAEKYMAAGHVFLDLRPAGYPEFLPTVTIAFQAAGHKETAASIDVGDKIQYTRDIDYRTGDRVEKSFFAGQGAAVMVSEITTWKPNVVSLGGYRKLQQSQTRFAPRPF